MQLLISEQSKFDDICHRILRRKPKVYLDTEFVRKGKTFHAVLSLIQIAAEIPEENCSIRAVVDAFLVTDLSLFGQILDDHEILKVLHAPSEDFRIFLHLFKGLPKNVFDTQCAASVSDVLGTNSTSPGNCIGYGKLCKAVLNIDVDKSMQNTDWEKRPLTKAHLDYAILDVEYLIPLERILSQQLEQAGKWSKYMVELASTVMKPEAYKAQPEKLTRRMCQETLDWYKHKEDQFGDVTFEEPEANRILALMQNQHNGIPGKKGPKGGGKGGSSSSSSMLPVGGGGTKNFDSSGAVPMTGEEVSRRCLTGGNSSCSTSATSSKSTLPQYNSGIYGAGAGPAAPMMGSGGPGSSANGSGSTSYGHQAIHSTNSASNHPSPQEQRSHSHQSTYSNQSASSAGSSHLQNPNSPEALARAYVLAATARQASGNKKHTFLRRFHALLCLREEVAAELDIPRQQCASDEALMQVACWLPTKEEELRQCNLIWRQHLARDATGREILLKTCSTFKIVAEYQRRNPAPVPPMQASKGSGGPGGPRGGPGARGGGGGKHMHHNGGGGGYY
ncbi:unnamed protein product [Amoebophrya sp. A120]|nr:unnamed protein product [Amoebophrya sp. A120]|eukprot:GSA120T00019011001.1